MRIRGSDLAAAGLQPGPVMGVAQRVLPRAVKRLGRDAALAELGRVVADPEANEGHEWFADVAAALLRQRARPAPFVERDTPAPYRSWAEDVDQGAIDQMENALRLPSAVRGALMPDAHIGYGLPIGGVLATEGTVIPYAVGVDIACRMKLTVLDLAPETIDRDPQRLERALLRETQFGVGAKLRERADHEVLDVDRWAVTPTTRSLRQKGADQLGTSGSGNHFVEFGVLDLPQGDLGLEAGRYLALLSHSGSRGSGAQVASHYSKLARDLHPELPRDLAHLAWLDLGTEEGDGYWAAMSLMGDYAAANHAVIHRRVARHLKADVLAGVENHHNYCISGDALVATPAGPRAMRDVRPGDTVYAFDADDGLVPSTVTDHVATGVKPVLEISTRSRRIEVTPDHLMLTVEVVEAEPGPAHRSRTGELLWKPAGLLQPGDLLVCAEKYYAGDVSWPLGRARLVGAMLGDGWVRQSGTERRGYSVGFAIGRVDEDHTAEYERRELLAGYIDADGSVADERTANHGRIRIATTSAGLCADIRELAIACGLPVTPILGATQTTNYGTMTAYRFVISAAAGPHLDLWHREKRSKLRTSGRFTAHAIGPARAGYVALPAGSFAQPIRSITTCDQAPVFDLTVEHGSHAFVADGVVVHNCWREQHGGRDVMVHRKGATPAGKGVLGVIPGSMASPAFVVRGRGDEDSLLSASHGAGRVMSRKAAKERFTWKEVRPLLEQARVRLLSAGIDENPLVYRDINAVMAAQDDLVDVVARFTPRIVRMADAGERPED